MKRLGPTRVNAWRVDEGRADLVRPVARPRRLSFRARPQDVAIDLNRSAMVVIDMQNDFCTKGGWLDRRGIDVGPLRRPVRPLNALLPALRAQRVPVIWLNWGNRADRLNLSPTVLHAGNPTGKGIGYGDRAGADGRPVLEKGSWGAEICTGLDARPEDISIDKHRLSGFWDNELDSVLRNLGTTTLLFGGVNVDRCVIATIQDAGFLGYDCILVEDCAATVSPDYCVKAVRFHVRALYGFLTTSKEILAGLAGA